RLTSPAAGRHESCRMDPSNQTSTERPVVISPLISVAVQDLILLVNDVALSCSLSFFGIFTNLANIIVFTKMGFSEMSNMNFLALSVFDLLVSIVTLFTKLFYSPVLRDFMSGPVESLVSGTMVLMTFVVIGGSAMMTALISTERCLCIVFPLKMKRILTPRRALYCILLIVAYHSAFLILLYADAGPQNEYSRRLSVYYFSFYTVPSTTCFFIVLFTTIAMVARLNKNLQWRLQTTQRSDKNTDKESKIAKTIIAISTIFIVCFFPNAANFIAQSIYPAYSYVDPYLWTLITVVFSFTGVLQALSSSINIVFYYQMSSRYKKVFTSCFCSESEKETAVAN
ncbi:hypothetical protein EGW08_020036, partial [Elysia chlorotica]